jgi:hypothetical protein
MAGIEGGQDDAPRVFELFEHAKDEAPWMAKTYMTHYWNQIKDHPITQTKCYSYQDYELLMPSVMNLLETRLCKADFTTVESYRTAIDAAVKSVFDWLCG